jgi:ATP-dependent DNA helicase MPH1
MEGKEENDWRKAIDSYQAMQEAIAAGTQFTYHAGRSRRILPREVQPVVDKRAVDIPVENSQAELPAPRKRKAAIKKKFNMPDNVETGFVTASFLAGTGTTKAVTTKAAKAKDTAKAKGAKAKGGKKTIISLLDSDEPEPLPPLDAVLLSDTATRDLQRRFQFTHYGGDDDALVSSPALGRHPQYQRTPGATALVPHGRATQSFTQTMGRMADTDEYSAGEFAAALDEKDLRPGRDVDAVLVSDAEDRAVARSEEEGFARHAIARRKQPPAAAAAAKATRAPAAAAKARREKLRPGRVGSLEASVGLASSSPVEDAAFALPFTQGVDLGSQDTPVGSSQHLPAGGGYDSDLDGFIVDDDFIEIGSSGDEEILMGLGSSFEPEAAGACGSGSGKESRSGDHVEGSGGGAAGKAPAAGRGGVKGRRRRVVLDSD